MGLKVYDPAQVIIIFGGHKIEGTAPNSRVKITHPEMYSKMVGSDSEVGRGKKNDRTGSVVVELMQTSASNDVLSAFFLADDVATFGAPQALMIKNLLGTALWVSAGAWIKKLPEVNYQSDVGNNSWEFDCSDLVPVVGGQVTAV